jgi:predicted transglutaminase-like cysteine proteinase
MARPGSTGRRGCKLALVAALLVSSPAFAGSKSEALLGSPSRLEQLAVEQSGRTPAPAPIATPAPVLAPVSADAPDVFGSTAIRVAHTPLDARWHAAMAGVDKTGGPWRNLLASARSADARSRLALVNSWVNRHIHFAADSGDQWASAAQSLSRGKGDCEDYAIAKMQLLRALGFRSDDLYLVIVRDLVRREDHAVLVARVDARFVVLDNGTDRILDANEVQDYRPVLSYSGGRAWLHGYRQPVQLTSLGIGGTGL